MSTEELKCPQPVPEVGEPIPGGEEEKTMSQSIIVMMALLGINSIALSYLRKARSNYPFVTIYPRCHCYNTNRYICWDIFED